MKKKAIIVLHEIYGVNDFIKSVCADFEASGFDVFCPNLIKRTAFSYEETEAAYKFFFDNVGFEASKEISSKADELKGKYAKVYIIGLSVGATLAFLCSENKNLSGVIGLYGSRIRDYTEINPTCPTLLLFAKNDSFDVDALIKKLEGKPYLNLRRLDASHGFMDKFSKNYNRDAFIAAKDKINKFLSLK